MLGPNADVTAAYRHVSNVCVIAWASDVARHWVREVPQVGVNWLLTQAGVKQQGHGVGEAPIRQPHHCSVLLIVGYEDLGDVGCND